MNQYQIDQCVSALSGLPGVVGFSEGGPTMAANATQEQIDAANAAFAVASVAVDAVAVRAAKRAESKAIIAGLSAPALASFGDVLANIESMLDRDFKAAADAAVLMAEPVSVPPELEDEKAALVASLQAFAATYPA